MFSGFRRFPARDDRGVTGVEYALIAGLVSLVVAGGAAVVGPALAGTYTSAGTAASGSGVTAEDTGLCAGLYATDPVTCDPETGTPDTSACPGLAQGDGSLGDPWACAAETPSPSASPTETPSPSASPTETPSPSASPTETPSATPTPTPSATPTKAAYTGQRPSSSYSQDMRDNGTYSLPNIAGIQYSVSSCSSSRNSGCSNYSLSGRNIKVDRKWEDDERSATITIAWSVPETGTHQGASGTFTVRLTSDD